MLQTIVNITGINAIVQSLLLAIFFWANKRGFKVSNRILALLLFAFGILIFSTLPGASYKFWPLYRSAFLLRRTAFLIAPAFYFYIQSSIDPKFRLHKKDAVHFIAFTVLLGLTLYQALVLHIWRITFINEYYLHTSAILIQNVIYLYIALRYLKRQNISLKSFFWESSDSHGKWLRFFILGYSIFWMVNFHNIFFMNVLKIATWCPYAGSIYCLIPFLFFNLIAFVALLNPEIFSQKNRNGNNGLNESLSLKYKDKLLTAMTDQKPYLMADLSMSDLAHDLSIPVKHLSYVINNSLNQNFYDFINQYRIEESKRLLTQNGNGKKTILEIAYEVGFNSKSTFNMAFKKQTGLTPSEYQKNH